MKGIIAEALEQVQPKLEERKLRTSPLMPNEKADIWSFGCLLVEALTGRKMFSASDKMASVLRPLQLLEMKIGETECRYHNNLENQSEEGKSFIKNKFRRGHPGIPAERF